MSAPGGGGKKRSVRHSITTFNPQSYHHHPYVYVTDPSPPTAPTVQGRGGGGGGKRRHYGGGDRPSMPAGPFVTLQALRKGRALLVTCEVGRERQAVKELRATLDRYAEEQQGDRMEDEGGQDAETEAGAGAGAAGSVRDALQQEIAALRQGNLGGASGAATIQAVDTVRRALACLLACLRLDDMSLWTGG